MTLPALFPPPRTLMWRRILDDGSFEQAVFRSSADGHRITGTILAAQDGRPLRLDYELACDAGWHSRHAVIDQIFGAERRQLRIEADGAGSWRVDDAPAPQLDGCLDLDLEFSPSTNSLPIRRLGLAVGHQQPVRAAWIRLPSLAVQPSPQIYERLADRLYRYRSPGFQADITVDDRGMTQTYQGIWARIAESDAPAE